MQPAPAPPRITLHLGGNKQTLQASTGAKMAGEGGAAASKTAEQHQHQSTKRTTTTTSSSSSSRIATAVAADLAALSNPDVDTAFRDADDAVDRLMPYHVRRFALFFSLNQRCWSRKTHQRKKNSSPEKNNSSSPKRAPRQPTPTKSTKTTRTTMAQKTHRRAGALEQQQQQQAGRWEDALRRGRS